MARAGYMTIAELIDLLREVPEHWQVRTTRTGRSLEAWDPEGAEFAYLFTDGRPTRRLTDQWRDAAVKMGNKPSPRH